MSDAPKRMTAEEFERWRHRVKTVPGQILAGELVAERARAERLAQAAKAAADWMWDPDAPAEQYERMAEEFYRATGYLRPGKSEPLECGDRTEERAAAWERWRTERARSLLSNLRTTLRECGLEGA
jgi:hypothetical protein